MTQSLPSVLLYGQALAMLKDLASAYQSGVLKTTVDVQAQLNDILSRFEASAGGPLTMYESISETEPPLSAKMNRFWESIQHDISLLQHQVDITRSSATFIHNLMATEVAKNTQLNAVVRNKLKTLQLYSDTVDSSVIAFGDNFNNDEFIDNTKVSVGQQAALESGNFLTLGHVGEFKDLTADSSVTVLPESNGFAGNNQEVKDPALAPIDPTTNKPVLTFIAESQIANDLAALLDNNPSTWFEYEYWKVRDTDKATASNFNFTYSVDTENGTTSVDWSGGPPNDVLKMKLQFDLGSIQDVNQISYIPYGLVDNVGLPIKVTSVAVSADGTNWDNLFPQNVWVGTDINLNAARVADNVIALKAIWVMQHQEIQYVRINLEQPNPINRPMGHIYWVDKNNTNTRVAGPVPNFATLKNFYRPSNVTVGAALQRREFFTEKRWAIGIRDITISQINYRETSTMVTKPIRAGGIVDRITLEADVFVPSTFDSSLSWIDFFISPNEGLNWFQLSRIQDDFLNLPEVIAFNDPTPEPFRESGVAYYNVTGDVTQVRLKIVMRRPSDLDAETPIIRSYRLKIKRR